MLGKQRMIVDLIGVSIASYSMLPPYMKHCAKNIHALLLCGFLKKVYNRFNY